MPGALPSAARPASLFTVGHEGLVQPELIDLLASAGFAPVLDVGGVPLSR